MTPHRFRTLVRVGFAVYVPVLFTATHWPKLSIGGPVPRPDIYIHIAAFGLWTALLIATEFLGPWRSKAAVAKCAAIGLVISAVDEVSQGIPGLGRHVTLDDYLANAAGVLLAGIAALIAGTLLKPADDDSR